jgi:DNA-binding FadR family transcriptional regulator
MAEVVADELRDDILRGDLEVLPRLEDLTARFDVGPPAVREALRILETEGLVTVRRGNVGGAEVHLPTSDGVAYMVSLVLQAKSADLSDVGVALRQLEPMCAAMCASRPDRAKTVVPELRKLVAQQAEALDDADATRELTDRFHEALVRGCGNETMLLTVGALERVWAAHARAVYTRDPVQEPSAAVMKASLKEHERLLAAIEKGDPNTAALARRHLDATHAYMASIEAKQAVSASVVASAIG